MSRGMFQFKNERQLFSFTGLTPSEFSSGEMVCRGHITRQGNSRVRGIPIEIAWRAIDKDPALAKFFNGLFPRTGKTKAIVAVARKLIGRIRAAFQKGEDYQLGYPCSISETI
jgi:transposase